MIKSAANQTENINVCVYEVYVKRNEKKSIMNENTKIKMNTKTKHKKKLESAWSVVCKWARNVRYGLSCILLCYCVLIGLASTSLFLRMYMDFFFCVMMFAICANEFIVSV